MAKNNKGGSLTTKQYLAAVGTVILIVAALSLFFINGGVDGVVRAAEKLVPELEKMYFSDDPSRLEKDDQEFLTFSPIKDGEENLDSYIAYCLELQNSEQFSSNVFTNAFLSRLKYFDANDAKIYDSFLKDAPGSNDPFTIVMNTIAINWEDFPELELQKRGESIMAIVAGCQ